MMSAAVRADTLRTELGGAITVRQEGARVRVSPRSTEEVAGVLRHCNAVGLRVEIAGAGTKSDWGGVVDADVLLETGSLRGVGEHSWQDLTATVGAGTPWAEMQAVLRAHGQMVGLDPLWVQRATVGGVLATNDSGAWRLRYGSARDLVIGMTIALADGTIARTGGKVVKNVAGYDLHKLMIGAFGTLGVITEVTFRLHPVRQNLRCASFTGIEGERALKLLKESGSSFDAVQIVTSDDRCQRVDVQISGGAEHVRERLERLHNLAGEGVLTSSECDESWPAREELFSDPEDVVLRANVHSAQVPDAIEVIRAGVSSAGGRARMIAQEFGAITVAVAGVSAGAMRVLVGSLREHLRSLGGSVVVVRLPDGLRGEAGVDLWGVEPSALPLMRKVKRQFDELGILNPGRFVGGI